MGTNRRQHYKTLSEVRRKVHELENNFEQLTPKELFELLPKTLRREFREKMSLNRLASVGFFVCQDEQTYPKGTEEYLFRKVLDKALTDSFSTNPVIKEDVDVWLDIDNEDFLLVCDLARLPPFGVYVLFLYFKKILRGKNAQFKKFGERKKSSKDND